MKKILLNLALLFVLACGLSCLILLCVFFKQLSESPTFLVHVIDYPLQYYVEQTKLIETWKTILIAGIVLSSILVFFVAISLIVYNFIDRTKFMQRLMLKKERENKTQN